MPSRSDDPADQPLHTLAVCWGTVLAYIPFAWQAAGWLYLDEPAPWLGGAIFFGYLLLGYLISIPAAAFSRDGRTLWLTAGWGPTLLIGGTIWTLKTLWRGSTLPHKLSHGLGDLVRDTLGIATDAQAEAAEQARTVTYAPGKSRPAPKAGATPTRAQDIDRYAQALDTYFPGFRDCRLSNGQSEYEHAASFFDDTILADLRSNLAICQSLGSKEEYLNNARVITEKNYAAFYRLFDGRNLRLFARNNLPAFLSRPAAHRLENNIRRARAEDELSSAYHERLELTPEDREWQAWMTKKWPPPPSVEYSA